MNKGLSYKTIKKEAQAQMIEKKSRFIASVRPVTTEQEALDFINALRSRYYDASHNVYAYVITDNNIARFSDDGEPSGTAGMPVLEVIHKEGLTDIVVVVTRYFGGTLLGAGGLVRAYGKSAKLGLLDGEIIKKEYCYEVILKTNYELLGKIRYLIENGGYLLGDIIYEENVVITAFIRYDYLQRFEKEVTEKTNGAVIVTVSGERYIDSDIVNENL